jgi:hypothetical protein
MSEKLEQELYAKERDRQYHMDAINRLASFLAFHGTSFEVVQAAMDNMSRMKSELITASIVELRERYPQIAGQVCTKCGELMTENMK